MTVKILYSTPCAITIHFVETDELESAEWRQRFTNVQDAIDMARFILRFVYPFSAVDAMVWDTNTGEILAEIERDD